MVGKEAEGTFRFCTLEALDGGAHASKYVSSWVGALLDGYTEVQVCLIDPLGLGRFVLCCPLLLSNRFSLPLIVHCVCCKGVQFTMTGVWDRSSGPTDVVFPTALTGRRRFHAGGVTTLRLPHRRGRA